MAPFLQGIALLLLTAQAAAPPKDPAKAAGTSVPALIEQLGSKSFEARDAASKKLEEIGEPALLQLRVAASTSKDAEVRQRAKGIVRAIEERLLARELKALHGVWRVVELDVRGVRVPAKDYSLRVEFCAGRMAWLGAYKGDEGRDGWVRLLFELVRVTPGWTSSVTPRLAGGTIDLQAASPQWTMLGVYAREGETAKLCLDILAEGRPQEFKSASSGKPVLVLAVLRREP